MVKTSGLPPYLRTPKEVFDELKDKTLIFVDTETTGLQVKKHQLTEIAAVAIKGPEFNEVGTYNVKINLTDKTKKQIEEEKEVYKDNPKFFGVERVLKYNKYDNNPLPAIEEEEAVQGFKDFCAKFGQPILVAQNAKFDMSFLGSRIKNIPRERVYDTKLFASYYFLPAVEALQDKVKERVRKRLLTKKDRPSSSLEYLIKSFAIREKDLHTALTDVRRSIDFFKKIIKYFEEYADVTESETYKKEQGKAIKKERYFKLSPGKKKFLKKQQEKKARNVVIAFLRSQYE